MRGTEHSIEEIWFTDTVLLCLVQLHNYAGCCCWNVSLWVSLFLSFSFSVQQSSLCMFSLPFHMNLICFISIFSSHISFFWLPLSISTRSWSCVAPLISWPLLLSFHASGKLPYTTKGPVHQHLSHFFDCCEMFRLLWDNPKGVGCVSASGLPCQTISKSCTESAPFKRKRALCWLPCYLSSVVSNFENAVLLKDMAGVNCTACYHKMSSLEDAYTHTASLDKNTAQYCWGLSKIVGMTLIKAPNCF